MIKNSLKYLIKIMYVYFYVYSCGQGRYQREAPVTIAPPAFKVGVNCPPQKLPHSIFKQYAFCPPCKTTRVKLPPISNTYLCEFKIAPEAVCKARGQKNCSIIYHKLSKSLNENLDILYSIWIISREIRPLAALYPPAPPPHKKNCFALDLPSQWSPGRYAHAYGITPFFFISLTNIFGTLR